MSDNWYSNRTQVFWTCLALAQGRTINQMDEIGEVKGWRLGAIIHNLRKRYKWPILTDYVGPERIAHYRLKADINPRLHAYPRSAKSVTDLLRDRDGNPGDVDG